MTGRFAGKVVWVTGASAGIGAALARAFAKEGARLILSGRRAQALAETCQACGGSEVAFILPLDLAELDILPDRAREAEQAFGPVDVLVNNAGISQRAEAADTRLAVDRYIMDVNYMAAVALSKAVLPGMLERGHGHIVAVTSLTGYVGTKLRSAYAASKHALHGFFDCLRAEVAHRGVRVTLVCPGFVRTEVSANALTGDGGRHGRLDPATAGGLDPDRVAARAVVAVARGRREVLIAGREGAAVYLQRFVPGLYAWLVRRISTT